MQEWSIRTRILSFIIQNYSPQIFRAPPRGATGISYDILFLQIDHGLCGGREGSSKTLKIQWDASTFVSVVSGVSLPLGMAFGGGFSRGAVCHVLESR